MSVLVRCARKDGTLDYVEVEYHRGRSFRYEVLAPRGMRFAIAEPGYPAKETHNLLCANARDVVLRLRHSCLVEGPR